MEPLERPNCVAISMMHSSLCCHNCASSSTDHLFPAFLARMRKLSIMYRAISKSICASLNVPNCEWLCCLIFSFPAHTPSVDNALKHAVICAMEKENRFQSILYPFNVQSAKQRSILHRDIVRCLDMSEILCPYSNAS